MAVFSSDDCDRLDYRILAAGGVSLYFQHEVLAEDLAWFAVEGYDLVQFDEEAMDSIGSFHFEARLKLAAEDDYGPSPQGFRDALGAALGDDSVGLVVVLPTIDKLAESDPQETLRLLDAIADHSRESMMVGRRILALTQSDDPQLDLGLIGGKVVQWNEREHQPWARGL